MQGKSKKVLLGGGILLALAAALVFWRSLEPKANSIGGEIPPKITEIKQEAEEKLTDLVDSTKENLKNEQQPPSYQAIQSELQASESMELPPIEGAWEAGESGWVYHLLPGKLEVSEENLREFDDKVARLSGEWKDKLIQIAGFADISESAFLSNLGYKDLDALSLGRAYAVAEYLKSRGIGEERISCIGYGSTGCLYNDDAGNQGNRRVVVAILESVI